MRMKTRLLLEMHTGFVSLIKEMYMGFKTHENEKPTLLMFMCVFPCGIHCALTKHEEKNLVLISKLVSVQGKKRNHPVHVLDYIKGYEEVGKS